MNFVIHWNEKALGSHVFPEPATMSSIIEKLIAMCVYIYVCKWELLSHAWLFTTPWTVACKAPLPMGFSRQEYRSGSPCPSPEDLPDPGLEPMSHVSPALQVASLLLPDREAQSMSYKASKKRRQNISRGSGWKFWEWVLKLEQSLDLGNQGAWSQRGQASHPPGTRDSQSPSGIFLPG